MTSHNQKINGAPHFSCLKLGNSMVPFTMLLAAYDIDASANCSKFSQSHHSTHFSCLDLRCKMVPLTTVSASHDARGGARCVKWQNMSCWPRFDYLQLTNTMVPLLVLWTLHDGDTNTLVSHDTSTKASCIMWCFSWCHWHHMAKKSCSSPFDHLELTNGMVPFMTLLISYDTDTSINGITQPTKLCYTLFQSSWPNEYSDTIGNAVGIICFWCQCQ